MNYYRAFSKTNNLLPKDEEYEPLVAKLAKNLMIRVE
jgi:hypothetical protein